jgi:hypothetical protein
MRAFQYVEKCAYHCEGLDPLTLSSNYRIRYEALSPTVSWKSTQLILTPIIPGAIDSGFMSSTAGFAAAQTTVSSRYQESIDNIAIVNLSFNICGYVQSQNVKIGFHHL